MQQALFLQRDELAQAYQLGEFQKEYTIQMGKNIAMYSVIVFIGSIIFLATFAGTEGFTSAIVGSIFFTLLMGGLFGGMLYSYRRLHIYVYTCGLIYLNGNKRRAVRWEQISKTLRYRSVTIYVKDEPRIGLPVFIDRLGELYATIEGEVTNPCRSYQD